MGRQRIESRFERDRCEDGLGKQYCFVAAIGAAAGLASAAITSSGAKSGANTQSAAADRATDQQAAAAAQMREDLSPWTSSGGAAQNKLNQLLGLGGNASGTTSMGLQTGLTPAQVREQLLSRYTSTGSGAPGAPADLSQFGAAGNLLGRIGAGVGSTTTPNNGYWLGGNNQGDGQSWVPGDAQGQSTIDEQGLNAAIQQYMDEQNSMNSAAQSDPAYGSLLKAYKDGAEYDAGPAFSFTGENLASDPGYQFGLQQGTQGIDRGQAARGNYLSGAAMKELTRFNEDYAGTKFNDAFNRASSTYNTNQNTNLNEWNTNLNAYNNNRSSVYNFLTGVSTLGQNSAAQTGSSNQQAANNIAGNTLAAGNAQAAGTVATGNALQSGINQAANAYNGNNPNTALGWNNLLSQNGGGYSGYTGYVGTKDPIAELNASKGWTG